MIVTAQADNDSALILGAIAFGGLLLVILALALARRRARRPAPAQPPTPSDTRDDLLVAIARLDLDYRNGKIEHEEWDARRAELKSRLAKHKPPEPAVE